MQLFDPQESEDHQPVGAVACRALLGASSEATDLLVAIDAPLDVVAQPGDRRSQGLVWRLVRSRAMV